MILLHAYDPNSGRKEVFLNAKKIVIAWQDQIGSSDPRMITKIQMENGKVFNVIETPEEIALKAARPEIEYR